ncbi:MAG: Maf family protein [Chlorobium sp.]|uniref:Maf family protein n=1 Tax=Chlorobium sp. TaxID=1095 RepID=UPI0025B971C3|nr:Maf family protein [Chlorobium sp.]MCF8382824.1 Maf family protein [Chlorobium sp.]
METPLLILASQSPRRKELLSLLGMRFRTLPVDTEERFDPSKTIEENVAAVALEKAEAAWKMLHDPHERVTVIGADTVVALNGEMLGKPDGYNNAFSMLQSLQNKTHKVHTGFALLSSAGAYSECVTTSVEFEPMNDREIAGYLDLVKPFDKAGSYGIQDPLMACYVRRIEGCYYNVVGLPVSRLCLALKRIFPEI